MGDAGEDDGADDSNHYAYESTEDGDKSGLDEELHQDVLRGGTYGMMFMIPMPPTMREMTATALKRVVMVPVTLCCRCIISV